MARSKQYSSDYIPAAYVPVGSNAAELRAMADANEAFGTAISGIGTKIKTGVKDWSDVESAKVENYLEGLPDDESRRIALADLMDYEKQAKTGGSQIGRFTNLEDVNEAVKEMQLRDFKETERAEQARSAFRLEDAFQYTKGQRPIIAEREKLKSEAELGFTQAQIDNMEADNVFQTAQQQFKEVEFGEKHRLEKEKHTLAKAAQELEKTKQALEATKQTQTEKEWKEKGPERQRKLEELQSKIDLTDEKIAVKERDTEKYERTESIKINVEGQAEVYTTIVGLEGTRYDQGAGITNLQESITKNRNDRVTNKEQKVLIDILDRHILETETTIDIATVGKDLYKNWKDFSGSGKSKLKNLIFTDLLEKYPAADATKLKDFAGLSITNSSYNDKFNKAIAIEKLGPVPLRNHKNRLLMEKYSKELVVSPESTYVNDYTTKRNDLVAKQATVEHLRVFDEQFRSKALQSFVVDLDTPEGKKLEFITKDSQDVTRSDIARLKAYIKKISKGPEGFKNMDASELTDVTNRTILDNKLNSKLVQTELDITADEEAALIRTKLLIREKISKKDAFVKAKEVEDKFRATASSRGQLGFNLAVRSPVTDYLLENASGDGWGFDDGTVDPDVIGKRINKVQQAIEKFSGPGFTIGDKAVAVRDLFLSSDIKERVFAGNQINIRLQDGTTKTVKDANPLELFMAAMSTTKAVPSTVDIFRSQIERFQKGQLTSAKVALENEIKAYKTMKNLPPTFLKKYQTELADINKHLENKNYGVFPKYTRNILDGDSNNPGYGFSYRSGPDPSVR